MSNIITKILLTAFFLQITFNLHATETCSRVAIINFQEILVDTNSTQKGEGLRYFLSKDPIAKKFLNEYQKGNQIKWQTALLGSLSTATLIAGLSLSKDNRNRKAMLLSGIIFTGINFIIAKNSEIKNEQRLRRAIDEYNKRNLPRIYFDEKPTNSSFLRNQSFNGIYLAFNKDF